MATTIEQPVSDEAQAATDHLDGATTDRSFGTVAGSLTGSSWLLPLVNAAAWVGLVSLVFAVAPPPDPDASIDAVGLILSEIFWLSALAAAVGVATRSRWAYALTAIGGAALLGGAIDCFAAGHTGVWIGVQALAGVGIATTGSTSWRLTR